MIIIKRHNTLSLKAKVTSVLNNNKIVKPLSVTFNIYKENDKDNAIFTAELDDTHISDHGYICYDYTFDELGIFYYEFIVKVSPTFKKSDIEKVKVVFCEEI